MNLLILILLAWFGSVQAADDESTAHLTIENSVRPLVAPVISNPKKIELGRNLFFSKKLSRDDTISCGSCHLPQFGGSDGRQFSTGIQNRMGTVNTPSILNASLNFSQFWDGRAKNLYEQIDGPVQHPNEMGSTWEEVTKKLKQESSFVSQFKEVYSGAINKESIVDAIVEFEKTLITLNSPFDQYLRGDTHALSKLQLNGYRKFQNYGCIACHQGINLGGNMYQTLGITGDYFKDRGGNYDSDLGRFNFTKRPSDIHKFKVPSLRNVAKTAPYFHDGTVKTLKQAIHVMGKYQLGRELSPTDINELAGFLESLTGETPATLKEPSP